MDGGERLEFPDPFVAYHRGILVAHANDPASGSCRVCLVTRCEKWRKAYDWLASKGLPMATADYWDPVLIARRKSTAYYLHNEVPGCEKGGRPGRALIAPDPAARGDVPRTPPAPGAIPPDPHRD